MTTLLNATNKLHFLKPSSGQFENISNHKIYIKIQRIVKNKVTLKEK